MCHTAATSFRSELVAPSLEEASLGLRVDERERAVVSSARFVDARQPPEELGARCVQVVVALEIEAVRELERGFRIAGFGDGDGAIQLDDG